MCAHLSGLFGRAGRLFVPGFFLGPRSLGFATHQIPNTIGPQSTQADDIQHISRFTPIITGLIFALVFTLIAYVIVKFRRSFAQDREPPQVYGSNQIGLAWTVIPVLIVPVLFLAAARVIQSIQETPSRRRRSRSSRSVTNSGGNFATRLLAFLLPPPRKVKTVVEVAHQRLAYQRVPI
jgi:heme/copper-type cytochrome/quinol oxidase subunit 2